MATDSQRSAETGPDLRLLFSELVRLETELWNLVESRLRAEFGVTLPVFEFMQVMSRTPDCRVQDIAAELCITVGGTSKIVDRIEAFGYCFRSANPTDRRSSIIKLTSAGQGLLPRLSAAVDEELRQRLGAATPDGTLAQLTRTLSKLRGGLRAEGATGKTA